MVRCLSHCLIKSQELLVKVPSELRAHIIYKLKIIGKEGGWRVTSRETTNKKYLSYFSIAASCCFSIVFWFITLFWTPPLALIIPPGATSGPPLPATIGICATRPLAVAYGNRGPPGRMIGLPRIPTAPPRIGEDEASGCNRWLTGGDWRAIWCCCCWRFRGWEGGAS